ncbi:DnaJ domain [Trinorchestia longiramus]|nr:DnaJ domain [Trinorchestia longiramus]
MEVFDVVEEVNQNFYELMGLTQDATVSDVKRAYRTLSKQIHPDKSDDPDAEIKFRQMVSVYEVLKDAERRAHYDRVLVNGLPDWRSAVYYYRRARKMSILEMSIILTVVISIAQYLMAWGSYWDRYKTFDEALDRKFKKTAKVKKTGPSPKEEYLSQIPKPSWKNILPLQVCRGLYHVVVHGPSIVREYRAQQKQKIQEAEEEKRRLEEEERLSLKEEEEKRARKVAASKRRKQVALEVQQLRNTSSGGGGCVLYSPDAPPEECASRNYNTGMWTDDELSELTKLMNKYPGGTVDRWDLISEQLNRAPHEVTKMAVKIREKMAAGTWLQNQQEEPIMAKVSGSRRANTGIGTSEARQP